MKQMAEIVFGVLLFFSFNSYAYENGGEHSDHAYHVHENANYFNNLVVLSSSNSQTTYRINFGNVPLDVVVDEIFLDIEFESSISASPRLFFTIENTCTGYSANVSSFRTKTMGNFLTLANGFVNSDTETIFSDANSNCWQFTVAGNDTVIATEIYLTYHVPTNTAMPALYSPDPYIQFGVAGSETNSIDGSNTLHTVDQIDLASEVSCSPITDGKKIPEGTKKLIILIHGWNPESNLNHYARPDCDRVTNSEIDDDYDNLDISWAQIYRKIGTHPAILSDGWKIARYDWSQDAATGSLFAEGCVSCAADAARDSAFVHGKKLGQIISSLNDYSDLSASEPLEVQLVAHSAGNWVARRAADYLNKKYGSLIDLQVTSLDAFINDDDWAAFGDDLNLKPNFRLMIDWVSRADNYYVVDNTDTVNDWTSGILIGWDRNVDIETDSASYLYDRYMKDHSGPLNWYARTADRHNQSYHASASQKMWFGYSHAYRWDSSLPYITNRLFTYLPSTNIYVFFAHAMDPNSFINPQGYCDTNISITGNNTYSAVCTYDFDTRMLKINPVENFDWGDLITVSFESSVVDYFGHGLRGQSFPIQIATELPYFVAIEVIAAYADDNTNIAPSVTTYSTAGITGVTADNLNAINGVIAAADRADADTVAEIQGLANSVVNAIEVIAVYADDGQVATP